MNCKICWINFISWFISSFWCSKESYFIFTFAYNIWSSNVTSISWRREWEMNSRFFLSNIDSICTSWLTVSQCFYCHFINILVSVIWIYFSWVNNRSRSRSFSFCWNLCLTCNTYSFNILIRYYQCNWVSLSFKTRTIINCCFNFNSIIYTYWNLIINHKVSLIFCFTNYWRNNFNMTI